MWEISASPRLLIPTPFGVDPQHVSTIDVDRPQLKPLQSGYLSGLAPCDISTKSGVEGGGSFEWRKRVFGALILAPPLGTSLCSRLAAFWGLKVCHGPLCTLVGHQGRNKFHRNQLKEGVADTEWGISEGCQFFARPLYCSHGFRIAEIVIKGSLHTLEWSMLSKVFKTLYWFCNSVTDPVDDKFINAEIGVLHFLFLLQTATRPLANTG